MQLKIHEKKRVSEGYIGFKVGGKGRLEIHREWDRKKSEVQNLFSPADNNDFQTPEEPVSFRFLLPLTSFPLSQTEVGVGLGQVAGSRREWSPREPQGAGCSLPRVYIDPTLPLYYVYPLPKLPSHSVKSTVGSSLGTKDLKHTPFPSSFLTFRIILLLILISFQVRRAAPL